MKKTEELGYNPDISNLIEDDVIPYDRKIYDSLTSFIKKKLWQKMDDEILGKIALILDDPKHEYDKDLTMTKKLLRHFLPTLKEKLWIHPENPVSKKITSKELVLQKNDKVSKRKVSTTTNPIILDQLIQQQLNLYHKNESASLLDVLLQGKNDTPALDYQLMEAKQTRKSIVANILTFMLLEDEYKKHDTKSTTKKITHTFSEETETE